ncbi:MAG TPA: hypothetical protein VIE69_02745 [Methylophilaceae bacterium]
MKINTKLQNKLGLQNKLILAPAAIVLFILLVLALNWVFDKRQEFAFQRIKMDAPQSLVVALLGAPDRLTACGDELWWETESRGANDGRCVQEAHYDHMLNSWTVGYSAKQLVVSKHYEPGKKH